MKEDIKIPLPQQEEGDAKNIESTVTLKDEGEAKHLFETAKKRLLNVNQWHELCGKLSAVFHLTDENGDKVQGPATQGNHFKIDIPGPGSASGKGYDWVVVEEVEEKKDDKGENEFILMRVRPASNPSTPDDNVAHFFSDKATSNFVIKREKNKVTAAVYGRNEIPNTKTESLIDKARNAIIGTTAVAGASNPQWKSLTDGLLGL